MSAFYFWRLGFTRRSTSDVTPLKPDPPGSRLAPNCIISMCWVDIEVICQTTHRRIVEQCPRALNGTGDNALYMYKFHFQIQHSILKPSLRTNTCNITQVRSHKQLGCWHQGECVQPHVQPAQIYGVWYHLRCDGKYRDAQGRLLLVPGAT